MHARRRWLALAVVVAWAWVARAGAEDARPDAAPGVTSQVPNPLTFPPATSDPKPTPSPALDGTSGNPPATGAPALLQLPPSAPRPVDAPAPAVIPMPGPPAAGNPAPDNAPPATGAAPAAPEKPPTPTANIDHNEAGAPVLVLQYPWKTQAEGSLQIALVTDDKADLSALKPIALDYNEAIRLWKSEVGNLNQPIYPESTTKVKSVEAFLEYGDQKRDLLTLRGHINALNKPAALGFDPHAPGHVVLYLLDGWIDEQGALRVDAADLDLTRHDARQKSRFADRGKLRIWLLNKDKTVWSLTADWPGRDEEKKPDHPAETPSTKCETPSTGDTTKTPPAEPSRPISRETPGNGNTPLVTDSRPPAPGPSVTAPGPAGERPPAMPWTAGGQPSWTVTPPGTTVRPAEPANPPGTVSVPASNTPGASVKPSPGDWHTGNAAPPSAASKTVEAPQELNFDRMSVDELANYIEKTWAGKMNRDVRRLWNGGWTQYYRSDNPPDVRRSVFMTVLRQAYNAQPAAQPELREALKQLYHKLKIAAVP